MQMMKKQVKVKPNAKKQQLTESDGSLTAYLKSSPVDDKANKKLIQVLTEFIYISKFFTFLNQTLLLSQVCLRGSLLKFVIAKLEHYNCSLLIDQQNSIASSPNLSQRVGELIQVVCFLFLQPKGGRF